MLAGFTALSTLGFRDRRWRAARCRRCRRRGALRCARFLFGAALAAGLWAGALYAPARGPVIDERAWGALFLPWAALVFLLGRAPRLGFVRAVRMGKGRVELIGAPCAGGPFLDDAPESARRALATATGAAALGVAAVVALVAGVLAAVPPLVSSTAAHDCAYGAYPLAYLAGGGGWSAARRPTA